MTVDSSKTIWLRRHWCSVQRYLDKNYPISDHNMMRIKFFEDLENAYYIVRDFKKSNNVKYKEVLDFFCYSPFVVQATLANQGMGKSSLSARFMEDIKSKLKDKARIVCLFVFEKYPEHLVDSEDYFFSINQIPLPKGSETIFIYCPELDLIFPAREFKGQENSSLNLQLNLFRQTKRKFFGEAKLSANVDICYWRQANSLHFKYIDKAKLIYGERQNFLTPLLQMMLPKDRNDKCYVVSYIEGIFRTFRYEMPEWFTDDLSRSFRMNKSKLDMLASSLKDSGYDEKSVINIIRTRFGSNYSFLA